MDFKNIPKKYRPIPFWSWNEKLETEKTKEQNAGQKVIQKFIEVSYQPYYEKYGTEVEGFLQMNLKLSGM